MTDEEVRLENTALEKQLVVVMLGMRLRHDVLSFPDLYSRADFIVKNSHSFIPYESSFLVDCGACSYKTIAASKVDKKETKSRFRQYLQLCREIAFKDDSIVKIEKDNEIYSMLPTNAKNAFDSLYGDKDCTLLLIPLRFSRNKAEKGYFIWGIEVPKCEAQLSAEKMPMLALDYSNALWGCLSKLSIKPFLRWCFTFSFLKLIVLLAIAAFISIFFIRVEHTIVADFVVCAEEVHSSYAWFDCVVKKCFFESGDKIRKGDIILEYDTERMKFQLNSSKAAYREAMAQYEQELKLSFSEKNRLGQLKLLSARCESAKVAIQEAQWYIKHSIIRSPQNGILSFADGNSDQLQGRTLRTGTKQFDILSDKGMLAEIMVNEKDASVLEDNPRIMLFLHQQPEIPIQGRTISARLYTELNELNVYFYKIRAKMNSNIADLRYGMRGVARITGKKVTLAYYLFRSVILWYRGQTYYV